jgi:transketolase
MNTLAPRLKKKSYEIRKTMLEMCIKAGTGHVTSSLSCIDILVSLYHGGIMKFDPQNPDWEGRDRFILSKGQASPALYVVLADIGFFDKNELNRFAQKDGKFGVHLQHDVPGVEITSGALGHGFGIAAGMALGAKMNQELYLVYALLGDGECYEGSIWETAMFASHNKLNNLVGIIDRNYLCVTDFTENLIELEPMEDKWLSFGWDVVRVDGHSFESIIDVLNKVRSRRSSKPLVIIADTVKGEGIECISNIPLWHGAAPKGKEIENCMLDLERRYNNG